MKTGFVYIISNKNRTVLYIGVTNNIKRRMYEYKKAMHKGFAKKYNCTDLLLIEDFFDITEAIYREKTLKKWKRAWKIELIQQKKPEMIDLSVDWFDENGELKEKWE